MHRQAHKNKPVKIFGSFDSFKFDERERKNNAVNHQKTAYGKGFGVPEVIRTPDLSLRRRSLYPAELRKRMHDSEKVLCFPAVPDDVNFDAQRMRQVGILNASVL